MNEKNNGFSKWSRQKKQQKAAKNVQTGKMLEKNLPCRKMPGVAVFHLRSSRPLPTVLHGQGLIRPGARLEKLANHTSVMLVLWGRPLKETIRNGGFSGFETKSKVQKRWLEDMVLLGRFGPSH